MDMKFLINNSQVSIRTSDGRINEDKPSRNVHMTTHIMVEAINRQCRLVDSETLQLQSERSYLLGMWSDQRTIVVNIERWLGLNHEQRCMVLIAEDFVL